MAKILLLTSFLFLCSCRPALPIESPKDVAFTTVDAVDDVLPEIRQTALECKRDLAQARKYHSEVIALRKELNKVKASCQTARSRVGKLRKEIDEFGDCEVKKTITEETQSSGPEYSPSDAPLNEFEKSTRQ